MSCFPNLFLDLSYFTGAHVDHSHLLDPSGFLGGGRLLTSMSLCQPKLLCDYVTSARKRGLVTHKGGLPISLSPWCPLHVQGCCHRGSSEHTAPGEQILLHLLYSWRTHKSLTLCHTLHNPGCPGTSPTAASCIGTGMYWPPQYIVCMCIQRMYGYACM